MTKIAGSGSTPKCHGLGTLLLTLVFNSVISGIVADPHHLNADPETDPSFHLIADTDATFYLNADQVPDPAPHQSDANLRYHGTYPPF